MAAAPRRALLRAIASRIPLAASSDSSSWQPAPALRFGSNADDDRRERAWGLKGEGPRAAERLWAWPEQWRAQIRRFGATSLQVTETRRLLRQVNIEMLKKQLQADGHKECVPFEDLIRLCQRLGITASEEAAERFVQTLDEAGVVLIFRGKVFLHPEEIAEKLAGVLPTLLLSENDSHRKEFELLHKELEEIDAKASRHVRNYLWMGLLSLASGTLLFFRLTFWEFSWDVMEPIAFFVTTGGLLGGYAYFLITHRDPTYLGLMHSLLANRRRKLMKRRQFDFDRYRQLEGLHHGKPGSGKQETVVDIQ